MARKAAEKAIVAQTQTVSVELDQLQGWSDLTPTEQRTVQMEMDAVQHAMVTQHKTRLAIGQHLTGIQLVLEPKRMFLKFLEVFARANDVSGRTLYRYIEDYKSIAQTLPGHVVKAAIEQNVDLSGKSSRKALQAVQQALVHTPKGREREALTMVTKHKKEERASWVTSSQRPEDALREVFLLAQSKFNKLPSNPKTRSAWVQDLCGMLITLMGVSSPRQIEPIAIPAGLRAKSGEKKRGRPARRATLSAVA